MIDANIILHFPEKKLEGPPAHFLEVSYLDIDSRNAIDVKVSVRDVNEMFAIISIETWKDKVPSFGKYESQALPFIR